MRYLITENQQDKLAFLRRLHEFDRYIKETPPYSKPCEYGAEDFYNAVLDEVTDELYFNDDVPRDFIDFIEKYMNEHKKLELIEYYNKMCGVE